MNSNKPGDIRDLILNLEKIEDEELLNQQYNCHGAWLLFIKDDIVVIKKNL